ncbi:MAG: protein kinase domain-containing protein [Longimicrobiales bacterium]
MFEIQTLGALDVRSEDGAILQSVLSQPKRAALLCFLAAARPGGHHSRDSLIAMFWPDMDPERARNALSAALHFLRRSLGKDAILNRNSDDLAINRDLLRCDVVELERLVERDLLDKALALYEGDFLLGFHVSDAPAFERWLDEERTRLRALAARAANRLALRLRAQGEWSAAIECARHCSALAPYDEERARALIDLLVEAGQSPAAIAFFESFARRLWEDLELEPSAETRARVESIRAATRVPVAHRAVSAATAADTVHPYFASIASQDHAVQLRAEAPDAADPLEQLRIELAPELEVLRLLGRGSTALAYLAREPGLKRLVTVKQLRKQLATDLVARLRFEREAQAAARISHTNVATVYRVGRLRDSCPYIVVEYVDGRTLADTIAACGALPQAEAVQLLSVLASALAAAHQQGVIHRDVRPGNIFVENRSGRVVLTDFGIAALLASGIEGASQLTPAGTQLGEVRYASPEQTRGELVTELSDVFAFGIIACEVLTGTHPLDAGPQMTDPQPVPQLSAAHRSRIPPELVKVVERCLAREANQRPRALDLVALLAGSR